MSSGTLYLVATPIGNLADITLRALEVLRRVDCIAAEDTRRSRKLLSHYDIHAPVVSYHSHNMDRQGDRLLERLGAGQDIALVTDAGTPGISDPGAALVSRAVEAGLEVEAIPGATALVPALVASGLSPHPFAFMGFPPRRTASRKRFFEACKTLPMTLVLYESPRRLGKTLEDILDCWGDRRVAVARELTKKHQECFRGTVKEALARYREGARGEITLVVEGASLDESDFEDDSWRRELDRLLNESSFTVKDAAKEIARRYALSRRQVYREALRMK